MAILAKKLNIKNSAGTTQQCNIYGTTGEAGSTYMYATVDGVQGYIPLVSTSDGRATSGRVLKSGTTYAIGNTAIPPYTSRLLTSNGTFTVPSGVTKLKVTCVGGGAGCFCYCGSPDSNEQYTLGDMYNTGWVYGYGGGTTTFGGVSAAGGGRSGCYISCGLCSQDRDDSGSPCCHYDTRQLVLGSGTINAKSYHCGQYGGNPGTYLSDTQGNSGTFGSGGGGGGDHHNDTIYTVTGATGYVTTSTINVTPGQNISYSIGVGGSYYIDWSYTYENGTQGAILVEYGQGIQ